MSADPGRVGEARLLEAARRRLRDSHGRPIRVSLAKLAGEYNLNGRQARRALRGLADSELLTVEERGGVIVVAPTRRAA